MLTVIACVHAEQGNSVALSVVLQLAAEMSRILKVISRPLAGTLFIRTSCP